MDSSGCHSMETKIWTAVLGIRCVQVKKILEVESRAWYLVSGTRRGNWGSKYLGAS